MNLKLILVYDVKEHRLEEYYQFVMGEFLPRAQSVGLMLSEIFQTAYGDYPSRLIILAAKDQTTMNTAIHGDVWDSIETKLGEFVINYEKRVVEFKKGFQFFIPNSRES